MQQLFEQSSQFRKWIFTDEKLSDLRFNAFVRSVKRSRLLIEEEEYLSLLETDIGVSEDKARLLAKEKASNVEFINLEEQVSYLLFCERKLLEFGENQELPQYVLETAIMFFKRYYLHHTIIDADPKMMMIAAIFLALKTENASLKEETGKESTSLGSKPLDKLLGKIQSKNVTREVVIEHEARLSQGVNFEFSVEHISWSLHGFFLDIQTHLKKRASRHADILLLSEVHEGSKKHINAILQSDLILTHWPSQIALSCLIYASKKPTTNNETFEKQMDLYLNDKLKEDERFVSLQGILALIEEKLEVLVPAASQIITNDRMKPITAKLDGCRNPEFIKESRSFRKKQEFILRGEEEERKIKIRNRGSSSMVDMNNQFPPLPL